MVDFSKYFKGNKDREYPDKQYREDKYIDGNLDDMMLDIENRRYLVPKIEPLSSEVKDFKLTDEFKKTFDLIENSKQHVFITGKAGCGKSTFLKYFRENTKKNIVVLAPTGIASINVKGQTIHSFFQFPITFIDKNKIHYISDKHNIFTTIKTLVIDEVSMVRADLLDAIDISLRLNNFKKDVPFGGIQIVMIGDLFQLSPVVENQLRGYFDKMYRSPFFFDAKVMKEIDLKMVELTKIFRQDDPVFIELLNKIRENKVGVGDLNKLNIKCFYDRIDEEEEKKQKLSIYLTATNAKANEINQMHLDAIQEPEFEYIAEITNQFDKASYPTDEILVLKKGSQVMMIRNDTPLKRWVNGSIGIVTYLDNEGICVKFEDGREFYIEKFMWEKIEYVFSRKNVNTGIEENTGEIDARVIGTFEQYPIRLSWAVTVHKSQGKTFDNINIDSGWGMFAHRQLYVALSRARKLEGIRFETPIKAKDIIFDKRVNEFFRQVNIKKEIGTVKPSFILFQEEE
jgi:ATP-dependent exoDNAse (exonuclease V) alpha subunit